MPIIVYKDMKELVNFSVSMIDESKRSILGLLSSAAMPSRLVAEQLGLPPEIVQDIINQLVAARLVIDLGIDKSGIKYYSAASPIIQELDIKELKPELEKLAEKFTDEFLDTVSKNHEVLEKIFQNQEGRYTLGRIVEYACGNVVELMQRNMQTEVLEESKRIVSDRASSPSK